MGKRIQKDASLERLLAARAAIRLIERTPRAFVVFRKAQLRLLRVAA